MKTVNLIVLAICAVSATADAFSFARDGLSIIPRVVGGKDAIEGQFPYQVSLKSRRTGSHLCGGSILNSRFILTSATCMSGDANEPHFWIAVVGVVYRGDDGVEIELEKIIRHKEYNETSLENDISLLQTATEIVFSKTIQPIALPTHDVAEKTQAVFSGWGVTSYPGSMPYYLQFAETQTISIADCIEKIKKLPDPDEILDLIHDSIICTSNPKDVSVSHGDEGGPLVDISNPENKTLVGIVAWTLVLIKKGYPDGFTRVYSYIGWIDEKIKEYNQ